MTGFEPATSRATTCPTAFRRFLTCSAPSEKPSSRPLRSRRIVARAPYHSVPSRPPVAAGDPLATRLVRNPFRRRRRISADRSSADRSAQAFSPPRAPATAVIADRSAFDTPTHRFRASATAARFFRFTRPPARSSPCPLPLLLPDLLQEFLGDRLRPPPGEPLLAARPEDHRPALVIHTHNITPSARSVNGYFGHPGTGGPGPQPGQPSRLPARPPRRPGPPGAPGGARSGRTPS